VYRAFSKLMSYLGRIFFSFPFPFKQYMEVIQVQPRDFYLHYIYVPVKGTSIRWTFTTKKNNIAFGLYHRLGLTPLPSTSDIVLKAQQTVRSEQSKQHVYNKKLGKSSFNLLLFSHFVKR
jgi:hypothetical protein